ncbi:MAG: hypothetical protein HKN43_07965, partial [Rhodothermales bacterium]|nr:hypothetical protein [Rhodothermales bacterium]
MNKSISIGLWDSAFLKPYVDAFVQSDVFDVTVTSPDRCEQLALAGMIDVGLMRPHLVLLHEDDLDVYGESAISSWRFPYAQLVLDAPIGTPITSIQYCSKDQLHAIVGRIVLNEHYGFEPQFVPADTPELHGDMTGFINTDIDHGAGVGKTVLDLGQEWFELTGYPMVWG